jgi:hypothetical protein
MCCKCSEEGHGDFIMNMITNGIFVANSIWILSHFVCSSFQRKNTKIKIERDNPYMTYTEAGTLYDK